MITFTYSLNLPQTDHIHIQPEPTPNDHIHKQLIHTQIDRLKISRKSAHTKEVIPAMTAMLKIVDEGFFRSTKKETQT